MERIFNGYKIKYEYLNHFMLPSRASRRINSINIFINLDDFFHKLHKPITDLEFQTTGEEAHKLVVSNIFNLVGHYKNWAVKEKLYPTIYLYYTTSKVFRNTTRIADYRKHYRDINDPGNMQFFSLNRMISDAITILPVIAKYIPRVYTVDSIYLEPSIIPLYLSDLRPADFNLLVSRDEYDLQYAAFPNWAVVSPKGDNSSFITKGSLWSYMKMKHSFPEDVYFEPFVFLQSKAIMGDKYRGIPKLTRIGWKSIVKYMQETSSETESQSVKILQVNRLEKYISDKKIENTEFRENIFCTDVTAQVAAMLDVDKAAINNQLTDMQDALALQDANKKLFSTHPINLNFLLREHAPMNSQVHDDYQWRKKS